MDMRRGSLGAAGAKAAAALAFAAAFLVMTKLVPRWGVWYAPTSYYREQTDALMRGELALERTPTAIRAELAWNGGGVQQCQGLGVPAWRLPFEALARLLGQPAFPDRLALGAALALLLFLTLGALEPLSPARAAAALLLAAPPALVTLCRFYFDIHEEASAYGCLYAAALLAGALFFERRPTAPRYLLLSLLAGLAGFVRPTILAYGGATLLLTALSARRRLTPRVLAAGGALFGLGLALLYWTNAVRFGSGLEFGHRINFTGFPNWRYDRFPNPYDRETLPRAAEELFAWLFRVGSKSPTTRVRKDILTMFDWTYLPVLAAAFGGLAAGPRRSGAGGAESPARQARVCAAWSLLALASLFPFYLRLPWMNSRYLLDFAPAFAAAAVSLLLLAEARSGTGARATRLQWALACAALAWGGWEVAHARYKPRRESPVAIDFQEMSRQPRSFPPAPALPARYDGPADAARSGIPYNGADWTDDGRLSAVVVLFVEDPELLRVTVRPWPGAPAPDYSRLRAKVGVETLEPAGVEAAGASRVVTFKGPERAGYRRGVQSVFLAYIDDDHPKEPLSPLRLERVEWRAPAREGYARAARASR
jgi:hypothetical protein